jgi:transcriptional regulator with XRE-family HTH domain
VDHPEPAHLTQVLKTAVRLSRLSYREIERRLGLHAGALSRLLNGEIELKVRHVELICEVIGLPAGRLLRVAFPVDEEAGPAAQMEQALATLYPGPRPRPVAAGEAASPILPEEIEQRVLSALRTFFTDLSRHTAAEAPAPELGARAGEGTRTGGQ